MNNSRIGLFGASGYSGMELTRLIAAHPHADLAFAVGDRWAGESVGQHTGVDGPAGRLRYLSAQEGGKLAAGCDAVFLATPAEVSLEWAPRLRHQGVRVVDLSGAFRLQRREDYPAFYGFSHPRPDLLAEAVYGLPELNRSHLRGAAFVANPGCYATAVTLALAPLVRAGLLEEGSVAVSAASGVSGAGRKAAEEYSFTELESDFRAYRVGRHQHTPEVAQTLAFLAGRPVRFTLATHLLPVKRGILATAFGRLTPGADGRTVRSVLSDAYGPEPFVQCAASPEEVSLKSVVGTNRCRIAAVADLDGADPGRVVVVSAIDNLIKGAAGQAIQNLNLMMGWDETAGLGGLRAFH